MFRPEVPRSLVTRLDPNVWRSVYWVRTGICQFVCNALAHKTTLPLFGGSDTDIAHCFIDNVSMQPNKLKRRVCGNVGPSHAAFLEPSTHLQNRASLGLFYRYYFGRCLSELAELVPLPRCRGRSTRYFNSLHDFSVVISRCYKDVVNSFFPRTARRWNSLSTEWLMI